jgi:hypothetical protein
MEELVHPEEEPLPSGHSGISISRPIVPDRPSLRRALSELEALVRSGDAVMLSARMKEMAAGSLVASRVGGGR